MKSDLSLLILDYERPHETRLCLESIVANVKLEDYRVTYLCNGSKDFEYAFEFYREGLVDDLIIRCENDGGSLGEQDMFNYCKTEFAIFIQCDQFLAREINESDLNKWIGLIEAGYSCVDLAGNQCGGKYSDRAHFISREFFNSIPNKSPWGPGHENPDGESIHNEYVMQKYFEDNNKLIYFDELYFGNNGCWSIRQLPNDNGISKMRTDTKQLWWVEKPKFVTEGNFHPKLTKGEWEKSVNSLWVDGTIPENYLGDSFKVW